MRTLQFGLKLKVGKQMNKVTTGLLTGLNLVAVGYCTSSAAAPVNFAGESQVNVEFYVGDSLVPVQCKSEGLHLTTGQASTDGNTTAKITCKNPNVSTVYIAPVLSDSAMTSGGGHWTATNTARPENPILLDVYNNGGQVFAPTKVDHTSAGTPTQHETLLGAAETSMTMRVTSGGSHPAVTGTYKLELRVGTWAA
ncbi:hypothetical protein DNM18_26615 [Salmonella enterica subsp. enterica]|nr:hypothetical protein [Salmonella enterica subsp. enterica serovar Poona]